MLIKGSAISRRAYPGEKIRTENKVDRPDAIEDRMIENIDLKNTILAHVQTLIPLLKKHIDMGDVRAVLDAGSSTAALKLFEIITTSENESTVAKACKEWLYMSGHKPVERSVSVNEHIEHASPQQLDNHLRAALKGLDHEDRETIMDLIATDEGEYILADINDEPGLDGA